MTLTDISERMLALSVVQNVISVLARSSCFAPDHSRETFSLAGKTQHGGHDAEGRALRYLEWTFDPDPSDTTYVTEYAYILHAQGEPPRCVFDRHVCGLFSRADWLRVLHDAGLRTSVVPFFHSEVPEGSLEVFVAVKPG